MLHRGPSHSLGAVLLILAAALLWRRIAWGAASDSTSRRVVVGLGVAYGTHVLLDWLGSDSSTPRGIMALWPFSSAFYISGFEVFDRVERRYWLPDFWRANGIALVREIVILGPVAWLVLRSPRVRGRAGSRTDTA